LFYAIASFVSLIDDILVLSCAGAMHNFDEPPVVPPSKSFFTPSPTMFLWTWWQLEEIYVIIRSQIGHFPIPGILFSTIA
jgi:hypothetical protein